MELKGRLKLIADKIPQCKIIADIGTDHAYIPIYAVQNGLCKKALATDIRKGPVEIAQKNIGQYGLQEYIEARLGNGIEPVTENEIDVIVIAGMGGTLMEEILFNGFQKARKAKLLILQPMNAVEVVRKWLYESGFEISNEALAQEGSKIYNVICSNWSGHCRQYDEYYYYVGIMLLNESDPLLKNYLQKKLKLLEIKIDGIEKTKNKPDDIQKIIGIKDRLSKELKNL